MVGTDKQEDSNIKEAGDGAAVVDGTAEEQKSLKKKRKTSRNAFNLDHIDPVGKNMNNLKDFSYKMIFSGRGGFTPASLARAIKNLILGEIEALANGNLSIKGRGTTYVYSTVPGSGKDVSYYEMKWVIKLLR